MLVSRSIHRCAITARVLRNFYAAHNATDVIPFEIVERAGRGKAVVATKKLLPGSVVMDEQPLFQFDVHSQRKDIIQLLQAMYSSFQSEVSPEDQARYLSLYGPIDEPIQRLLDHVKKSGKLSDNEAESAVKVFSIYRLNTSENGVYDNTSRLAHSCAPNCHITSLDDRMIVRTLRHVEAGDELTISYRAEDGNLLPTHKRRLQYLMEKDFTCHCSRCDADGDDTRQFECLKPDCRGFHAVRHPIGPIPSEAARKYTGVEYVSPHLLPCSLCHSEATVEYQKYCFELEGLLEELAGAIEPEKALVAQGKVSLLNSKIPAVLRKVQVPARHVASLPLMQADLTVKMADPQSQGANREALVNAAMRIVGLYDRLLGPVNAYSEGQLTSLGLYILQSRARLSVKELVYARNALQRALRIFLVSCGRDSADGELLNPYNAELANVLKRLDALGESNTVGEGAALAGSAQAESDKEPRCAFCGEAPSQAAMVPRYCSGCGGTATMYCSEGCQKAHWSVHLKHCPSGSAQGPIL